MVFHPLEISAEIARGLDALAKGDYYSFGYSVGKALDILMQEEADSKKKVIQ